MKKTLLLFLVSFFMISMNAQEISLDHFWGLDFSMNKQQVYNIVKKKKSNKGMSVENGKTQIVVNRVNYNKEVYNYALMDFYRDKLLAGFFFKKIENNQDATVVFLRIRNRLTQLYGKPKVETADVITCYWVDAKKNLCQLTMNKKDKVYQINLLYLNGVLNSHKLLDEEMGLK